MPFNYNYGGLSPESVGFDDEDLGMPETIPTPGADMSPGASYLLTNRRDPVAPAPEFMDEQIEDPAAILAAEREMLLTELEDARATQELLEHNRVMTAEEKKKERNRNLADSIGTGLVVYAQLYAGKDGGATFDSMMRRRTAVKQDKLLKEHEAKVARLEHARRMEEAARTGLTAVASEGSRLSLTKQLQRESIAASAQEGERNREQESMHAVASLLNASAIAKGGWDHNEAMTNRQLGAHASEADRMRRHQIDVEIAGYLWQALGDEDPALASSLANSVYRSNSESGGFSFTDEQMSALRRKTEERQSMKSASTRASNHAVFQAFVETDTEQLLAQKGPMGTVSVNEAARIERRAWSRMSPEQQFSLSEGDVNHPVWGGHQLRTNLMRDRADAEKVVRQGAQSGWAGIDKEKALQRLNYHLWKEGETTSARAAVIMSHGYGAVDAANLADETPDKRSREDRAGRRADGRGDVGAPSLENWAEAVVNANMLTDDALDYVRGWWARRQARGDEVPERGETEGSMEHLGGGYWMFRHGVGRSR